MSSLAQIIRNVKEQKEVRDTKAMRPMTISACSIDSCIGIRSALGTKLSIDDSSEVGITDGSLLGTDDEIFDDGFEDGLLLGVELGINERSEESIEVGLTLVVELGINTTSEDGMPSLISS